MQDASCKRNLVAPSAPRYIGLQTLHVRRGAGTKSAQRAGGIRMARDTQERQPRDSGWINLEEPGEVRYWASALSVTEERLRAAVRAAGDASSAVRQYLGGQQRDAHGEQAHRQQG